MRFIIIYGSVRESRLGIRAARLVERTVRERNHTPVLIDPAEYDFGLLERMYKEYPRGEAPEKMEALAEHIGSAHGVIVVSAEYNHAPPAALTNLMSHFLEEWRFKPCLITTYSAGSFGGVRAGVQLRSFIGELGMVSVSRMIPFPNIGSFSEAGVPGDERASADLTKGLVELEWYADALKRKRDADGPAY